MMEPWGARGPILAGLAACVILVGGFGAWAATTTLAGALVAAGTVAVPRDHHLLQHPEGGVIATHHVEEGERVRAGDALVQLDDEPLRAREALLVSELHEAAARIARHEAERDGTATLALDMALVDAADSAAAAEAQMGQQRLFETRRAAYEQQEQGIVIRQQQLERQLDGIDAESTALQEQRRLLETELSAQRALRDKGLTNQARVLGLEREDARIAGQLGKLAAERARVSASVGALDLERVLLGSERVEESQSRLRELRPRAGELRAQIDELRARIATMTLRAPGDGIVHELHAKSARAVVKPGDPVISIVPVDRPLVVRARIRPDDIDQVYPDQVARINFPAFGMRDAPELDGRVTNISPDVHTDSDTGERYFGAEIAIDPGDLETLDGRELTPGMRAETRLRTQSRTPLDYLVGPFVSYISRALRDG